MRFVGKKVEGEEQTYKSTLKTEQLHLPTGDNLSTLP